MKDLKKVDAINEEHLQDIVDENDEVIGVISKADKFEKELITRNAVAFIKDSNNKFIIVKRSPLKKSFPNLLDLAACGHVMSEESYEDAIRREIMEELSIECPVELLKKIYHEHEENGKMVKYYTGFFIGQTSKEVKANEEFEILPSMDFFELAEKIEQKPEIFTPFFIDEFKDVYDILLEMENNARTTRSRNN